MPAAPDLSTVPLSGLLDLSDRVAVVTGGARGIGGACCARLAEAGAAVVVGGVDLEAAQAAAAPLPPPPHPAPGDRRAEGAPRAPAHRARAPHPPPAL